VLAGLINSFGQSAGLFVRSPNLLVDASEMVLQCVFDVILRELGPFHPDSLDCLNSLAWFLLNRGRL